MKKIILLTLLVAIIGLGYVTWRTYYINSEIKRQDYESEQQNIQPETGPEIKNPE